MPNILLTGVATLDIINHLPDYPAEDSEVRATAQHVQTGGNASNSAIVMQQLGLNTHLLASRADDFNAQQVFTALNARHIDTSLCPLQKHSATPTSYITLNSANGSRSIVHYRNLRELQADDFTALALSHINWFHFEARACDQLRVMLKHAARFAKPISIELEKPREGIDDIMQYANLLLISRPFALSRGFSNARQCLHFFAEKYPDAMISCTWGEQGAWLAHQSHIIHQPAFNVKPIIETLGAGDTFNGGLISALIKSHAPAQALAFACELAANKCRQFGLDNLTVTDE